MVRELVVATIVAGTAVGLASAAGAEPQRYRTDVPGIVYDAQLSDSCTNWERYIYGRGPGGEALACHFIPNQFLPPAYNVGWWQISYPLVGEREIGSACDNPQTAAQSPDGLPLVCVGARGWQPGIYVGGAGPYADPGIVPYPLEHPQEYFPPFGTR